MVRGRKRAYLMVLAVGALALAVDQCVLTSGGTEPSTAIAANSGLPVAGPSPGATAEPARSIPELPFPRGLKSTSGQMPIRDLFFPPNLAGTRGSARLAADKGRRNASDSVGRAMFVTRHRLDGVMALQRLRIAVVDGAWIRVGDSLDGCELTDVSGNEARFECADGEATLEVIGPAVPKLRRD